jgi:hypothetical protein
MCAHIRDTIAVVHDDELAQALESRVIPIGQGFAKDVREPRSPEQLVARDRGGASTCGFR